MQYVSWFHQSHNVTSVKLRLETCPTLSSAPCIPVTYTKQKLPLGTWPLGISVRSLPFGDRHALAGFVTYYSYWEDCIDHQNQRECWHPPVSLVLSWHSQEASRGRVVRRYHCSRITTPLPSLIIAGDVFCVAAGETQHVNLSDNSPELSRH